MRTGKLVIIGLLLLQAMLAGCRQTITTDAGVTYAHLTEATPWSIHAVTFDLARKELAVVATVGKGVQGSETVPAMVASLPRSSGEPIAAINGDYFEFLTTPRYRGTLEGTCIVNGELAATPAFPTFWILPNGHPQLGQVNAELLMNWPDGRVTPFAVNCSTTDFKSEVRASDVVLFTPIFGPTTMTQGGRELVLTPEGRSAQRVLPHGTFQARVREVCDGGNTPIPPDGMVVSIASTANTAVPAARIGDRLTFSITTTPSLTGVQAAVSGGPLLLTQGQLAPNLDNTQRHPRSAVGIAGTRVVFVAVDGRQPQLSVGMTYRELAELMQRLGCTEALNLDGGGSTTLWYQGRVVNSPSGGSLRPVGNALVLVRRR